MSASRYANPFASCTGSARSLMHLAHTVPPPDEPSPPGIPPDLPSPDEPPPPVEQPEMLRL
ncbi:MULTISPECIES: hypothetical protein [Ralstonia]|jgi:hypothetical protein|uniref:Uncharacterized protein n=1 Tax=Ralstonia flaminis TaxID=3058597 RepID=A0ABN9JLC1_9RALS|nr:MULTISPECIES: hypothetical protein [unclassified Ralstonia]CAJ0815938.1 hypothetical protein LMG18101_02753 [Ralstonia sp. LMG 18101]